MLPPPNLKTNAIVALGTVLFATDLAGDTKESSSYVIMRRTTRSSTSHDYLYPLTVYTKNPYYTRSKADQMRRYVGGRGGLETI